MVLSVVIPCYRCSRSLEELHRRLRATLPAITGEYEIIFVNDGSPEDDWRVIRDLCREDPMVVGINLSRNFGQQYATAAGLDFSRGNWVVVMDGDLEHRPEDILRFWEKSREGFDVVVGRRINRKTSAVKLLASRAFYAVFNYLSEMKGDSSHSSFGLYSRKVIDSVNRIRERNRNFYFFAIWTGFRRAEIDVQSGLRTQGGSGYTFFRMVGLAVDTIIGNSDKLLKISIKIGFVISFAAFSFIIFLVIRYFTRGIPAEGWTSVIASMYLLGGMVLCFIGVVGIYIGKIFEETKGRPLYIIDEIITAAEKGK